MFYYFKIVGCLIWDCVLCYNINSFCLYIMITKFVFSIIGIYRYILVMDIMCVYVYFRSLHMVRYVHL